ncbi:hypothetical protein D6D04_07840 [Aureobasidium pullulans]|nr:hypothetical protein D6D04_07840 [Aureobasidium pullulans]
MSTPRAKPLEKLITATSKCTLENVKGAAYGKCIAAEYQNVRKDMCAKEFMQLKNCYLARSLSRGSRAKTNIHFTGSGRQKAIIS